MEITRYILKKSVVCSLHFTLSLPLPLFPSLRFTLTGIHLSPHLKQTAHVVFFEELTTSKLNYVRW